ncbi:type IV pilus assembly protein PilM [Rheinheimera sp.]|uniref:type IV pilus assembly protein PilM n=1 Tax=Rheinheimera sp. TaxID=1869214 RepID=UPI00307EBD5E
MLNRLFPPKKNLMLGVDIGSHSIKAVLLSQQAGHYKVEAIAIEPMPADVMMDRDIRDIEAVSQVLSRVRRQIEKTVRFVATAVSGAQVISKVILLNAQLDDAALARQIELDAESLIPYPLHEVSLDFEVLGQDSRTGQAQVLLTAARTVTVQSRVSALEQAGFLTKVVDVESAALSRAVPLCYAQLPADAMGKRVAVLDIGASLTLLCIVQGEQLLYSRDLAFGGQHYTNAIASFYGKTSAEAERAKQLGDLPPSASFEVTAPFQTQLLQQLRRALQMYLTTSGNEQVDYILLSGGSACLPGLAQLLADELAIHTVLADPLGQMHWGPAADKGRYAQHSCALLIACGLALRGFSSCHL